MRGREIKHERITRKEMGYLVGFFLGDGYMFHDKRNRHYSVEFYLNSREKEAKDFICQLLRRMCLNPHLYADKRYNCIRIRVRSRRFFELMKAETRHIRDGTDFNLGVISGLIDSDGYVNKEKRYIQFQNTSIDIMGIMKRKLTSIGIESKIVERSLSKRDKKRSFRMYIPFKFMESDNISIKAGSQRTAQRGLLMRKHLQP
jgi:intein-encoded DNA endonuclease-like protein